MDENKTIETTNTESASSTDPSSKIKTRQGSGYLKQLYSTARTTAGSTHSPFKNLTTFLVNLIPTEKVDASELQVRVHFDDAEIQALAYSIKEHGVLQPILVVQNGDRYKVIAGERRLRAAKMAGVDRIPARVLSTDDKATHEIALRENLDRVDLHPLEEGEGYLSLLEAQLYTSHDSIAKAFGKPKSRITECIGFTRLPEETKAILLQKGTKNRSLLRQLMNAPIEQHAAMIEEAEQRDSMDQNFSSTSTESSKKGTPTPKEIKPFEYKFEEKGIVVPVFKWKHNDGPEKLYSYADSIRGLLQKIDERLEQLTRAE